ncbi:hypothetical protein C8255_07065 [filamentous cyanobacterium CCP3]|nr:hypothetical protein C8255_07065 [filamentous cyanobacterium CCP3]
MRLIKLFIDEDSMDQRFVSALRARGVDVVTVNDLKRTGFSDQDQLQLAAQQQRSLYTFNVGDFCRLHSLYLQEDRSHSGIIISSQEYSVGEQMRRVLRLMDSHPAAAMINQLVFLSQYGEDTESPWQG